MKKISYVIISSLFFLFSSFRPGNGDFLSFLEKTGIKFAKPPHSIETEVINNDELHYQYALKDTLNNLEIRYVYYPLQELVKHYNGPHSDTGMDMIDPNFMHTNVLLSFCYKIQGKEMNLNNPMPEVQELSHATVDLKYNADWGAYIDLQPCDEFAQKYKYCTLFAMHKDNIADIFIIYLYNNKDAFLQKDPFGEGSTEPDFMSLVFNKK
jgi:hypothetical protein